MGAVYFCGSYGNDAQIRELHSASGARGAFARLAIDKLPAGHVVDELAKDMAYLLRVQEIYACMRSINQV